jgi:myo-inositol catabolism protein IolC
MPTAPTLARSLVCSILTGWPILHMIPNAAYVHSSGPLSLISLRKKALGSRYACRQTTHILLVYLLAAMHSLVLDVRLT